MFLCKLYKILEPVEQEIAPQIDTESNNEIVLLESEIVGVSSTSSDQIEDETPKNKYSRTQRMLVQLLHLQKRNHFGENLLKWKATQK